MKVIYIRIEGVRRRATLVRSPRSIMDLIFAKCQTMEKRYYFVAHGKQSENATGAYHGTMLIAVSMVS